MDLSEVLVPLCFVLCCNLARTWLSYFVVGLPFFFFFFNLSTTAVAKVPNFFKSICYCILHSCFGLSEISKNRIVLQLVFA